MPRRTSKAQPAVMGPLSPSKRGVATKGGVYVISGGRETTFLTDRELDAIEVLRHDLAAQRAEALEEVEA